MTIPLQSAYLCETCQVIFGNSESCPLCASGSHMMALAPIINRDIPDRTKGGEMSEIIRWWTTCEDGIHSLGIAPPNKGNWVRYADHLAAISALEDECETKARQAKIAERWAERYRMCVEFLKHPGEPSEKPIEWSRQLIEELSAAEAQVAEWEEVEEYLPDETGSYQTLGERAKLLKDQMEYAAESSGQLGKALAEANAQIAVLKEALKIACADAWPNQPQWPELYESRATENIQTAPKEEVNARIKQ